MHLIEESRRKWQFLSRPGKGTTDELAKAFDKRVCTEVTSWKMNKWKKVMLGHTRSYYMKEEKVHVRMDLAIIFCLSNI